MLLTFLQTIKAFPDFAAVKLCLATTLFTWEIVSHEVEVTIKLLDLQRIRYIRVTEQNTFQLFI